MLTLNRDGGGIAGICFGITLRCARSTTVGTSIAMSLIDVGIAVVYSEQGMGRNTHDYHRIKNIRTLPRLRRARPYKQAVVWIIASVHYGRRKAATQKHRKQEIQTIDAGQRHQNMSHAQLYLSEVAAIGGKLDCDQIEALAAHLDILRGKGGRLFIAGLGGSAANALHAANDFRKLCGIDAYCLSDNVAELTARANDEGWKTIFDGALHGRKPTPNDALLILSVGGGTDTVSFPLVAAMEYANRMGMKIYGIVGRDGGKTKELATCCVLVPTIEASRVTPHTESFQSVILHLLVSHPKLQRSQTKW